MRISHILYSGFGGLGSVVFSYLTKDELKKNEHSLVFFGIEEIPESYIQTCKQLDIPYNYVKKINFFKRNFFSQLVQSLKEQKPDVIIVHSLPAILPSLYYRLFHSGKVALVEHASLKLKRLIDHLYSFIGILFSNKVVFLTPFTYTEMKNRMATLFPRKKVSIISNGIDTDFYAPNRKPISEEFYIVTHCRFIPLKNIEMIISAFHQLITQNDYDVPLKLTIAGDGVLMNNYKSLTKQLKIEEHVLFPGFLDETHMLSILQKADLYINASSVETMSTSIMQAMSCGLPIIASNINGNRSLIEDNVNGKLFNQGVLSDLVNTMKLLIANERLRKRLGAEARMYAQSELSIQKTVNAYSQLFEKLND